MLDENQLTVIDENGNELLCEILFTFDSDDYNKSYVVRALKTRRRFIPLRRNDPEAEEALQ